MTTPNPYELTRELQQAVQEIGGHMNTAQRNNERLARIMASRPLQQICDALNDSSDANHEACIRHIQETLAVIRRMGRCMANFNVSMTGALDEFSESASRIKGILE